MHELSREDIVKELMDDVDNWDRDRLVKQAKEELRVYLETLDEVELEYEYRQTIFFKRTT